MTDEIYQAEGPNPQSNSQPNTQPNTQPDPYSSVYQSAQQPQSWDNRYENRSGGGSGTMIIVIIAAVFIGLLVIVGGLAALLYPAIGAAREAARRMQCSNNMKQISLALLIYHDAYKSFPPAYTVDAQGNPLHSWRVLLLPYIEQNTLYESINLDEPWDSPHNSQFHRQMSNVYACNSASPELLKEGKTTYKWIVGPDAISNGPDCKKLDDIIVKGGGSNTFYLVESTLPVCWMDPMGNLPQEALSKGVLGPRESAQDPSLNAVGSTHNGGVNVGLLDGSVMFISQTIDVDELQRKANIHGPKPAAALEPEHDHGVLDLESEENDPFGDEEGW